MTFEQSLFMSILVVCMCLVSAFFSFIVYKLFADIGFFIDNKKGENDD
jgi:hypothetical protein